MMLLAAALFLAPNLAPRITIVEADYHEHPHCFRMSNGTVDLVVAPQIGRIIRFGRTGGPNLLFESQLDADGRPAIGDGGWPNYGGDKLWPAPQSLWGWPPEAGYDSTPWTLRTTPTEIVMRSTRPGEKTGVVFQRTIAMSPGSAMVKIHNEAINGISKPIELAVWEVCQVDDPMYCILPRYVTRLDRQGWHTYGETNVGSLVTVEASRILIRRDPNRGLKYGVGAPAGYVGAKVGSDIVTLQAPYLTGALYPDEGKAQQVYTSGGVVKYCELEINSPIQTIAPGGHISLDTTLRVESSMRSGR